MPVEITKPLATPDNSLPPALNYFGTKARVKFNGSCLKQDKITYTHGTIINTYTVYELGSTLNYNENVRLENCFFRADKLTKNAYINKYKCSGYSIGSDINIDPRKIIFK